MATKILGLKIINHDTGAALIYGDKVFAISQERLDRKKHSAAFPKEAINYCLNSAGLKDLDDIDIIAVEQININSDLLIEKLKEYNFWPQIKNKVVFVNHHDAHAASAFFCSPFNDAAVMVIDNAGQRTQLDTGLVAFETESFYRGSNSQLSLLSRNYSPINRYTGRFLDFCGIGKLYADVTYFINFGRLEEGKTMGLAPYGKGIFIGRIPEEQFIKKIGPMKYIFPTPLEPHPDHDWRYLFKKHHWSRKAGWIEFMKQLPAILFKKGLSFEHCRMFKSRPAVFSDRPRRLKENKLPDDFYTETAYWVQYWLEKTMIDYANSLYEVTKSKNLCIAGGVGLNSVANKKIIDATSFENIFIQPAAGDSGLALGCALWAKHQLQKKPIEWRMNNAYLGRPYSENEVVKALAASGKKYIKLGNPAKTAAKLIAQEKIIGWFQGKSEYGPRALGNRSIICSPIPPGMKDRLNSQVKHRESFRPFAPAVLEEKAAEYFDLNCNSPFMLLVAKVKKGNLPAITHVDGTGRIQTVSKEQNPAFYNLIEEFEKITGVPVVLNTSFNNNGEPIVESPSDAIKSFETTNLDALIIHNYLIER